MRYRGSAWLLLVLVVGVVASGAGASETACLADSIRELRLVEHLPGCSTEEAACRTACEKGDAKSCLSLAYVAEEEQGGNPQALYDRACRLGLANACTNYAARIWAHDHTQAQLRCAARLFDEACAANEHFACGMAARVALENATSPSEVAALRRTLEKRCATVGGFTCRILAKHLEGGDLGPYEPDRIAELLERACRGGDPDACGRPATATETFD